MRKPAIQALTCWVGAFLTIIVLLFTFLGPPGTSEGASEAVGRGFAHTGITALCVWLVARVSANPWSWLKFLAFYVLAFIAVSLVSMIGHIDSANGQTSDWPYKVKFPDGWAAKRMRGASSAPQDEGLGVREIARRGAGEGAPVMQLACVWRDSDEEVDLDALIRSIADKLETQYSSARTRVQTTTLATVKVATYPTRAVVTRIFLDDELVMQQESLIALTNHCLFSAEVGAVPSEFQRASKEFASVIGTIEIE